MRVRRTDAQPGTLWASYLEVAGVHNVGAWRQFQVMTVDGDWATWSTDTTFEVEPSPDITGLAIYAVIAMRDAAMVEATIPATIQAAPHIPTIDDMPPLGTHIRVAVNDTPTWVRVCGSCPRRGMRVSNRMWGGTVDRWLPPIAAFTIADR
jgi:hypothetical protein